MPPLNRANRITLTVSPQGTVGTVRQGRAGNAGLRPSKAGGREAHRATPEVREGSLENGFSRFLNDPPIELHYYILFPPSSLHLKVEAQTWDTFLINTS